jgi:hypothetical protein
LHVNDVVHVKGSKSGSVITATEVNVQQGADTPGGGNQAEETVRGVITGVSGTCPDARLSVAGKTVVLTSDTQYRLGATCTALTAGVSIEAQGTASGSTVTARTIKIEDGPGNGNGNDDNGQDQRVTGAISGLGGNCPNRSFRVAGRTILVTAATQYLLGTACGALADGVTVEVEGPASGSTITAKTVKFEDGPAGDTTLRGTVTGRGGSCPDITFTVQGKTVTTTASTLFRKATCEQIVNGTTVEAEGVLIGNTLAAKKVQLEN